MLSWRYIFLAVLLFLCRLPFAMAYEEAFEATAAGEFEVKALPSGLLLKARAEEGAGYFESGGRLFRPLFRYISDRDIAMTVPVEAGILPGEMYFWISPSERAKVDGPTEEVEVIEMPARMVASYGLRGGYLEANFRDGEAALRAWLETQNEWVAVGESGMVYWNGPFVPWFLKRSEVHIPVMRASELKD